MIDLDHRGNISSRFSSNSEADASELPENLDEQLPCYFENEIGSRRKKIFHNNYR